MKLILILRVVDVGSTARSKSHRLQKQNPQSKAALPVLPDTRHQYTLTRDSSYLVLVYQVPGTCTGSCFHFINLHEYMRV